MIENYEFADEKRVGIIGWSHGGLISLMNIFDHPEDYQCAFAGVPVSDLIARMGYHNQSYRDLYEADYHIGKSANILPTCKKQDISSEVVQKLNFFPK